MQQNGELSVEEILESIKKVIARDNKDSAQSERYRRETEGVVLRSPRSAFRLTPMGRTGNNDQADEAESESAAGEDQSDEYDLDAEADSEVLDLGSAAAEMLEEGEAESDASSTEDAGSAETAPTAADGAETAASEMIEPAVLDGAPEEEPAADHSVTTIPETTLEAPAAMPEFLESPVESAPVAGETPLERMVRESLRPMLREWLDTNLPPIVEQMVKTELERIMGKSS